MKPCLSCGLPTPNTRCPTCQVGLDQQRNSRRTHYQGDWARRSSTARSAWVAQHGWWCPGIGVQGHAVKVGGLALDHTTGTPLCPACNNRAGPAGPDAAIPH